ncbi:hypothetical protein K2W90_01510 [Candidatus Babeliales bacterium]|nr:hypothetical protein [Candidatus Babeliales bacterium]
MKMAVVKMLFLSLSNVLFASNNSPDRVLFANNTDYVINVMRESFGWSKRVCIWSKSTVPNKSAKDNLLVGISLSWLQPEDIIAWVGAGDDAIKHVLPKSIFINQDPCVFSYNEDEFKLGIKIGDREYWIDQYKEGDVEGSAEPEAQKEPDQEAFGEVKPDDQEGLEPAIDQPKVPLSGELCLEVQDDQVGSSQAPDFFELFGGDYLFISEGEEDDDLLDDGLAPLIPSAVESSGEAAQDDQESDSDVNEQLRSLFSDDDSVF